ncbi:hypothetical protein K490DRAFT_64907 [Saccharata proteae CBS 121410]|uniref:Mid2 domain-containing protein n=1 Tax=Saccharata proteae CBS 121410 TaxID=1314787 RepID=A0A9P4LW77_9PEZI|nr:hypothetical protein K490DRAFT_64907 [Saccharata proteae CBS 121410]
MWNAYLVSVVLSYGTAVSASSNYFNYPTAPGSSGNFLADLSWELGSSQTITWTTSLDEYSMYLYHQKTNPDSGIEVKQIYTATSNGSGDQSFDWTVQLYDTNLTVSPVYFFWIDPGATNGFTLHYFNITEASSSSSSASSTTTTATDSISSSTTSASTAATTTSAKAAAAATTSAAAATASGGRSSSSSSSTALKAGLGVGLGLGIPLVLIAGIWIGLKMVKARRASAGSVDSSHPMTGMFVPPGSYRDNQEPPFFPLDQGQQQQQQPEAHMVQSHEIYEAPANPANPYNNKRTYPAELGP